MDSGAVQVPTIALMVKASFNLLLKLPLHQLKLLAMIIHSFRLYINVSYTPCSALYSMVLSKRLIYFVVQGQSDVINFYFLHFPFVVLMQKLNKHIFKT